MTLSRSLLALVILGLTAAGCSHNPHKAEESKTVLENAEDVGANVSVGQNDKGEVMASRKEKLADQLRDLQKDVYEMETEIYGDNKLGRKGLYGVLRECLDAGGEVKRLPSRSVLTKGEDKFSGKMKVDEAKKLVSVNEEYFLDRIKRFEGYKDGYEAQKDDFEEKLRVCKTQVKNKSSQEQGE